MPKDISRVDPAALLTFAEVSQLWRTQYYATLYRLRKAQVPVVVLGPGKYRVRLAEILKMEKAYA